jgi:hypothetical protein
MESRSIQIRFDREHRVEMTKVNVGTGKKARKSLMFSPK